MPRLRLNVNIREEVEERGSIVARDINTGWVCVIARKAFDDPRVDTHFNEIKKGQQVGEVMKSHIHKFYTIFY
jgi:hypothetical protein